jgi:hypothetical protein
MAPMRHGGVWAYGLALLVCLVALAAIGAVILHPYVMNAYHYPLGWDAGFYVWRTEALAVDGLARVGTIRAGFPLLAAALGPVTGANGLTLVAVLPAVLAGVAGLGAAAMLRAALGVSTAWIPVSAFLLWAGFGPNEIPLHHLDNLLNAALILPALAAALMAVGWGRGALAAGGLFAAAGLAHWPFFVFAMGVYLLGLAGWAWPAFRAGRRAGPRPPRLGSLLVAGGGSAAFVALTLLAPAPTGWGGARPGTLRAILRERIQARLRDPSRFAWVPVAAGGAVALDRGPRVWRDRPYSPRRLLMWWFGAWLALTVAAGVAQVVGAPTAGARLLSYFFPATLLVSVALWALWRWSARRWGRAGVRAGTAAVMAAVIGFGALMWSSWSARHPWVEADAPRQVAAAAAYVEQEAADREVVYVLDLRDVDDPATIGRWWLVVKALLPPEQVPRTHRYVGSPADYLARIPSRPLGEGLPPGETDRPDPMLWGNAGSPEPVAVVLRRYNPAGFEEASEGSPQRVIAPGVLVLQGPEPSGPILAGPLPAASTDVGHLLWVAALSVAVLFAVGGGWAVALLPADATLRVTMTPALGAAAVSSVALAWDRAGMGFGGWASVVPLLLAGVLGWGAVWIVGPKARPSPEAPAVPGGP